MTSKKTTSIRLETADREWLERDGLPMAEQLRDDIARLRYLERVLGMAEAQFRRLAGNCGGLGEAGWFVEFILGQDGDPIGALYVQARDPMGRVEEVGHV